MDIKFLQKFHGQQTVDNLLAIFHQLKSNARCIFCSLGAGQLGYLGAVLSPKAYTNKIPNADEFVHPKHPGPSRLVVDSTNPAPNRSRAHATATRNETDAADVIFTHADITQQKATHEEAS